MKQLKPMCLIVLASLLGGTSAWSADPSNQTPMQITQSVLNDIHNTNIRNIELGNLAQEKGRSDAVKSYGATLVADHQAADKRVQEVASAEGINLKGADQVMANIETTGTEAILKTKSGADFDAAFAKDAVDDHRDAINKLTASQRELDPNSKVSKLITTLLPTLQKNEDQAKKLEQRQPS
jgi:putative membrane protein